MQDTKLIRVLKSLLTSTEPFKKGSEQAFDTKTLKSLQSFLESGFSGTAPILQRLFTFICQFAPEFEDAKLTDEEAFSFLYSEETFDASRIRRLRSKLLRQIYKYIFLQEIMEDPFAESLALLQFFGKKEMISEFNSHLENEINGNVNSPKNIRFNYFMENLQVQKEINKIQTAYLEDGKSGLNYQETIHALDAFFIHHKLVYACQMQNRQNVFKGKIFYDFGLMPPSILENTPDGIEGHYRIYIKVWQTAFKLLSVQKQEKAKYYHSLSELMNKYFEIFPPSDIRTIYTYLQNNVKNIYPTEKERLLTQLELYKAQIDKEVFLNNFTLTPSLFINIITVYLHLEDIPGAEKFLSEYKGIFPVSGDDIFQLCEGMILFEKGQFAAACELTGNSAVPLNIKNLYHRIRKRRLLLKCYYELEDELFEHFANSFRVLLSRKKEELSKTFFERTRKFINITVDLFKLKLKKGKFFQLGDKEIKQLKKINTRLKSKTSVFEQKWLKAKLEELL